VNPDYKIQQGRMVSERSWGIETLRARIFLGIEAVPKSSIEHVLYGPSDGGQLQQTVFAAPTHFPLNVKQHSVSEIASFRTGAFNMPSTPW
jgi:hypothetical protein